MMHHFSMAIAPPLALLTVTLWVALAPISMACADVTRVIVKATGSMGVFKGRQYIWVTATMEGTVERGGGERGQYCVPIVLMYMDSDYHYPQGYRRPRLWDEALRQWQPSRGALTHQAPQPAQAHQPEAARAAWSRHRGPQQRSQIGPIAVCGQRFDLQRTTHADHPQGGHGQPEACYPLGGVHLGILPLPPTPLETSGDPRKAGHFMTSMT
jgi:hypothetical protein